MPNSTLFDERLALVYWRPGFIVETSMVQFAGHVRAATLRVKALLVKTNNGVGWRGKWDSSNLNLAVNSFGVNRQRPMGAAPVCAIAAGRGITVETDR